MNPAETLLNTIVASAEMTRKAGFTVGAITYALNIAQDTVTGTFTIPVTVVANNTTGKVEMTAQDFLEAPAP